MPPRCHGAAGADPASPSTDRLLYDVLGVPRSATPAEVHRAYRLRALKVHPDKNPGDETAKESFLQLRRAYETLSDPERRHRYDELGDASEDGDLSAAEALRKMVRTRFRKVTVEEIVAFEQRYRGSDDERADITRFVMDKGGNVSSLLEYIVCSEPKDVGRLVDVIRELMKAATIPKKLHPVVHRSIPKLLRSATTLVKRDARERKALARSGRELGDAPESLADLASAIQERQLERARAFSGMAESVVAASTARAAARKRPAAPDADEAEEVLPEAKRCATKSRGRRR